MLNPRYHRDDDEDEEDILMDDDERLEPGGVVGELVHHIDVSAKVAVRQDLSVNSDLLN